jgi:hypothetical protein
MPEFSPDALVPPAMPLLSRGKHRNPSRGACFMEFTSLLAGGPFTDAPRCVDGELAAVLRGANDKLSDDDRPLLVPLLGRAIGLAVEPPAADGGSRLAASSRRRRREEAARYREQAARLRRAASRRFLVAVAATSRPAQVGSGEGDDLSGLFWDLMGEPTPFARSEDYVRRLVDRLRLLHECYERAMDDVGLSRAVPTGPDLPVPAHAGTAPVRS